MRRTTLGRESCKRRQTWSSVSARASLGADGEISPVGGNEDTSHPDSVSSVAHRICALAQGW